MSELKKSASRMSILPIVARPLNSSFYLRTRFKYQGAVRSAITAQVRSVSEDQADKQQRLAQSYFQASKRRSSRPEREKSSSTKPMMTAINPIVKAAL